MKPTNRNFVPLNQASLCLDCEMVTAAPNCCPACGSGALMSISRALSRPDCTSFLTIDNTIINERPQRTMMPRAFSFRPNTRTPDEHV